MNVHHFGIGSMRPYGGALFDGRTPGLAPANLVCHCLLLETSVGLILIDTGLMAEDAQRSAARISPFFRITDRVSLPADQAASSQIRRLGHRPEQVRHIIMTHLDFDHVGGLPDFPDAIVHLSRAEAEAARRPSTAKERARYRTVSQMNQSNWHAYDTFPADFFGVKATYLEGIPGLMLVWLPGHTKGHCGVAINIDAEWLLHAGDAVLNGGELDPEAPSTPTAARLFQWFMESSQVQRRHSLAQLRRIRRDQGERVRIICTHDPAQLALSGTERGMVRQRSPYSGG